MAFSDVLWNSGDQRVRWANANHLHICPPRVVGIPSHGLGTVPCASLHYSPGLTHPGHQGSYTWALPQLENLKCTRRAYSYRGHQLWKGVSPDAKQIENKNEFKAHMKKLLVSLVSNLACECAPCPGHWHGQVSVFSIVFCLFVHICYICYANYIALLANWL